MAGINLQKQRIATEAINLFGDLSSCLLHDVGNDHFGAFTGKGFGAGLANTRTTPGNNYGLIDV